MDALESRLAAWLALHPLWCHVGLGSSALITGLTWPRTAPLAPSIGACGHCWLFVHFLPLAPATTAPQNCFSLVSARKAGQVVYKVREYVLARILLSSDAHAVIYLITAFNLAL